MPIPLPSTGMKYTDLTVATAIAPADILCFTQTASTTSLSISYQLMQFLIQGALTYVNSATTISGNVFGYMGDGSAGTFTITLPAIGSWTGGDIPFVNVGPSGTFSIAAAGSDNIINTSGSPVASITSLPIGNTIVLRPMASGGTGVPGWYVIGVSGITGSGTTGKAAIWSSSSGIGNPTPTVGSPTLALTSTSLLSVGTPSIAAGAGLGTAPPTPTITGNDQSGYITFTPGTIPSASSVVVTITFGTTWAAAPKAVIIGAGSTNVMGVDFAAPPSGYSTTGFTITIGTVALATGTYIIPYACF